MAPAASALRRAAPASWRALTSTLLLAALCAVAAPGAFVPRVARAQSPQPVPALSARVTDLTGTLDAAQRAALEAQLVAIEQRKGAQVAVLIVATTQPETIEAFGIRVAEAWKLGRGKVDGRRVDDGVLLLVAKGDRKVRIEVGYGLEGAIPDAMARRIIAEAIAPKFRTGDFHGGLQAAIADIGRLIDGEPLPQPWQGAQGAKGAQDEGGPGWLAGLLMVLVGGMVATAVLGRLLGATAGGLGAGAFALFLGAALWVAVLVAVAAFVFFLVFVASGGRGMRPGPGRGARGGPVIWTGGGGWGGGSSGGGFSGGGGGFGGGGASGDW